MDAKPRLIATVAFEEPEPRLIRRILGYRVRRRVIFSGYVDTFDLDISQSGIASSTVVVRDPTDSLGHVLRQS